MNAIEIQELFFAYSEQLILEDVNLTIKEGEFIGIFGPNGGGKTTLLQLIMGFLKPLRGSLSVFGKKPQQVRPAIGWVPQSFYFDREFPISVEEVVLGGRLAQLPWYGRFNIEDREIAHKSLEEVGLCHTLNAPFASLSGGQMQRVLIARALACNPRLLLLDEPTASIDLSAEREVYELLHNLKGKMTILMVTHDLKSAVEKVDRLLCVQKSVSQMSHTQVCDHFALGLYHPVEEDKS